MKPSEAIKFKKEAKEATEKFIISYYGKRCGAFTFCCPQCEVWMAFDIIFNEPATEYKITKLKQNG